MKTKEITQEIVNTEIILRELIEEIGISRAAEKTGLKYQDIQAWLKGRRRWSYEKILNISEKLDIS